MIAHGKHQVLHVFFDVHLAEGRITVKGITWAQNINKLLNHYHRSKMRKREEIKEKH